MKQSEVSRKQHHREHDDGHQKSPSWLEKAQKYLFFLGQLKKLNSHAFGNFYRRAEEIILETLQINRRPQQWVIKTTQNITGTHLLSISVGGNALQKVTLIYYVLAVTR